MGCNSTKNREEVIKSISLSHGDHIGQEHRRQNPDPSEEESIKQVSCIVVGSDNKPRFSEDPSMFKMIQDI